MMTRLRYLAQINPRTPTFDLLPDATAVTFMPLETVWADARVDTARTRPRSDVQTGYVRFRDGDVLVPRVTPTFQAGRSAVVTSLSNGHGAGSTELHVLRARPNADARYLSYITRSAPFLAEGVSAFQGVAGLQRVPEDFVRDYHVPNVPLAEQRRIADFLDDQVALLDRAIELRRRQIALFREAHEVGVRNLLTAAGTTPLIATGSRWFPRLPPCWTAAPLKYRWRVVDCKHRTPVYVDEGYPLVSTGDITVGRLDLTRTSRFVGEADFHDLADPPRRPVRGDIVYSRNASLGTACYVDTDEPFTMGQDVCRITSEASEHLYLAHALNYLVASQLDYAKVGSTFSRINIEKILNLVVPCPPRGQQQEVGAQADALIDRGNAQKALLRKSTDLLRERQHALITAAVTGEFDVTAARSVA